MFSLIKKAVMAGLGVGAQGREKFEELVRQGEQSQTEVAKAVKKMMTEAEKNARMLEDKGRELAGRCFEKMPIPTRSDVERLEKKIQDLADRIERGGKGRG
jgi:polyhydroxyalkanoate synthesis regulator phasin